MSNSPLVTYTRITNDRTSPRNHVIDTITIHCYVGQVTAKQGCDYFATTTRNVSSNYVVGCDGSIGLSVPEADRAWTTSSKDNDHRAITVECACDKTAPYALTDAAYDALIRLVADICKRNNIEKLLWKADKSLIGKVDQQNMTVHRWFSSTSCPGAWLYERHGEIAAKVNEMLGADKPTKQTVYYVQAGSCDTRAEAEALLKKVKDAGFKDATIIIDGEETQVTYTVKKGDTLIGIARKMYGNSDDWKKIAEANGISGSLINVGQVLVIPT